MRVPIDAKFTINDGQHRRVAFEMALRENPQLGKEEKEAELAQKIQLAVSYWNAVSSFIPDWQLVLHKQVAAAEIRRDCVHCHSVVLESLGEVGASLLSAFPESWEERLAGLSEVDWSVSNPDWEGGILVKGRVLRSRASVSWMTDYLKNRLGLEAVDSAQAGRPCHNQGG